MEYENSNTHKNMAKWNLKIPVGIIIAKSYNFYQKQYSFRNFEKMRKHICIKNTLPFCILGQKKRRPFRERRLQLRCW